MTKTNIYYTINVQGGYWFQDGKWLPYAALNFENSFSSHQRIKGIRQVRKIYWQLVMLLPVDVPFQVTKIWVPAARLKGKTERLSFTLTKTY